MRGLAAHAIYNMSKEEYEFKQRQKRAEGLKQQKMRSLKKWGRAAIVLSVLISAVAAGAIHFGKSAQGGQKGSVHENAVLATSGVHWHPQLSIKIKGQEQEIPGNIGLGITESPTHTHEADGIIHLEFAGRVTEDNARLGKFFEVWGKTFNRDCIFDNCNGPDGQLKMLVNGAPNDQFEDYVMRDGDQIEIIFEQPD